jgi:hypothetical protein
MGYSVVFIPIGISFMSLAATVVGVRFIRHQIREGASSRATIASTVVASVPIIFVSPYLGVELILIVRRLFGI